MTMKNDTNIPEAETVQQNQGTQQQPQPKKSSNAVLVIVIVVVVVFGILPVIALVFLGNFITNFLNSKGGEDLIEAVVRNLDNGDDVIGVWDCKPYNSGSKSELEADYTTTLNLRHGGTFQYGKYGDLENNSYSGKYDVNRANKKQTEYRYYTIKFSDVTLVEDGEPAETKGLQDLEMGLDLGKDEREAVMMFANYNTYYCSQR